MANNNTAFVLNGYSYADAKITFDGIELPGVTSFEFSQAQTKTNNYGLGQNPVSRSKSIKEYSGSIEMDYDTMGLLTSLSTTTSLTDVPSGIMILSLAKEDGGKEIITMPFFEFQGDGLDGSQGDENLKKSIDIIFGGLTKVSY